MDCEPSSLRSRTTPRMPTSGEFVEKLPRLPTVTPEQTRIPRSYRPRHDLRVLRVSAGTSPIEHKAGSEHDEHMDVIVEEIMGTYIGSYASPGLLLAAAASFFVLITGLGARIFELGQAARWAHREYNRGTLSPDTTAARSSHPRRRITVNMNRRSRPLYRDPSDKMIGGVCSVRAPIVHPLCVLNGFNGPGPQPPCRNGAPPRGGRSFTFPERRHLQEHWQTTPLSVTTLAASSHFAAAGLTPH